MTKTLSIIEEYITELQVEGRPKIDSSRLELPLISLPLSMKAKTIVELGVRDGHTTLPLLIAAHLMGGILHSIDINPITFRPPSEYKNSWELHQNTDALKFLSEWPKDKIIDFVFIDDWHAFDHVKKELELLDPLVSPSSIIAIHDTMYAHWEPHYHCDLAVKDGQWANGGPYRAVAELNQNFWEFSTLPINCGLTILRKKYSNKYHW